MGVWFRVWDLAVVDAEVVPNVPRLPCLRRRRLFEVSVRTGSWTGPPRGKGAPRVEISQTVFGVRA